MGLTLTLTDTELPASPSFIEFLHATLTDQQYHVGSWFQQEEEHLDRTPERYDGIAEKVKLVMNHPDGVQAIVRSYRFFKEMLTGQLDTLKEMRRYRFMFVIGIPRTGGTYITKQLFRAAGIDYSKVQNALAHDGFPHLAVLSFHDNNYNVHTTSLLQLAEYLTMVDMYFSRHGRLAYQGGIVVPKKFTKAIYNFPLIRELFGSNADYVLTLRHPLGVINSVLEKSGGMPAGGKFEIRSAIERWALDDWLAWQVPEHEVMNMSYVDVMLGYWKRFHFQLAMSGIPSMPSTRIVTYGEKSMQAFARESFQAFGTDLVPEAFKQAAPGVFSTSDQSAAVTVMDEVDALWRSLSLPFPLDALSD